MKKLYKIAPNFIQNIFVTGYNFVSYRIRYGGTYDNHLKNFNNNNGLSIEELKKIQNTRFLQFFEVTNQKSIFYKKLYADCALPQSVEELNKLPIVNKEDLRKNIKDVYTIESKDGVASKTGGTTGKSLNVIFSKSDMQERFAMLDNFRNQLGYKLGKKTAWFSGKEILTARDISKNRFWKKDYLNKVKYYSTFHIKEEYMSFYLNDLIEFRPQFIVGFPSSILEIAKYGLKQGINFPQGVIKAIFPTAETVTEEIRNDIESFFKTKMYDQYASSEGAPFIFECKEGKLHVELQSGVFEVLDNDGLPVKKGRLVVTSFTTSGTPLIRYDIGDEIELSNDKSLCPCGNSNPMVKKIMGRVDDYIYSLENGKINLGNVSNTLKDTKGIIKFQAIQNHLSQVEINVVIDKAVYSEKTEKIFLKNWKARLGNSTKIELKYVSQINTESSGKFRLVKNNIKHLI